MGIYQRVAAVAAATVFGLGTAACSTPAAALPVTAPSRVTATVTATPTVAAAQVRRTTSGPPTATARASRAPAARKASTAAGRGGAGCGQRAVTAGRFDPSCPEYQGYLDPGTAGGRAPTSGEIQMQYLCRTGQVPRSEC